MFEQEPEYADRDRLTADAPPSVRALDRPISFGDIVIAVVIAVVIVSLTLYFVRLG